MKKAGVLIGVVLTAQTAHALPPLSPAAVSAFREWHLCVPPGGEGYFGPGSRRFAAPKGIVTWRAQTSLSAYVRQAMGLVQGYLVDPSAGHPVITLQEVPYSDASANITVRVGDSIDLPAHGPYPVTNGCITLPRPAADKMTYVSIEIVCHSAEQVGLNLAMHEIWWHAFLTMCHTRSGFGSGSGESGAPLWEGAPGHRELARWLYAVPAGSIPR